MCVKVGRGQYLFLLNKHWPANKFLFGMSYASMWSVGGMWAAEGVRSVEGVRTVGGV